MSDKWVEAPNSVVLLVQELVNSYHPDLKDARIGLIFRETASISKGVPVIGHVQKTPEIMKVYLDYDFIIWLADDAYSDLDENQRKALIDHQLCHCTMIEGVPCTVGHDVEEFQAVINRHGLWNSSLLSVANSIIQMSFDFAKPKEVNESDGYIGTILPEAMADLS